MMRSLHVNAFQARSTRRISRDWRPSPAARSRCPPAPLRRDDEDQRRPDAPGRIAGSGCRSLCLLQAQVRKGRPLAGGGERSVRNPLGDTEEGEDALRAHVGRRTTTKAAPGTTGTAFVLAIGARSGALKARSGTSGRSR
jgi:hypothetical protein